MKNLLSGLFILSASISYGAEGFTHFKTLKSGAVVFESTELSKFQRVDAIRTKLINICSEFNPNVQLEVTNIKYDFLNRGNATSLDYRCYITEKN